MKISDKQSRQPRLLISKLMMGLIVGSLLGSVCITQAQADDHDWHDRGDRHWDHRDYHGHYRGHYRDGYREDYYVTPVYVPPPVYYAPPPEPSGISIFLPPIHIR